MEFLGFAAFVGIWILLAWHGKKQRWSGWTRHLLGAGLGLAAFALIAPQPAGSERPEPQAEVVAKVTPPKNAATPQDANEARSDGASEKSTLGLSLDQYIRNFNSIGAAMKPAAMAYLGEIAKGPVNDVATIKIDDHRMLTVTLLKGTTTVKGVTLIGRGDGTDESGIYLLLTAMTAAQAAVPESGRAEIGPAMGRLLKRMQPNEDSVSEVVGGRKVWMLVSDVTGFMAGISPAD